MVTTTVGFLGQSVPNYMFTVSDNPPPCPAGCYMLNRTTLTWGPVTGNGAISYAAKLKLASGADEVRLYNASWDASAMSATYAPPPGNLWWANPALDGPLASFFSQVSAGGYVPNLLELNQGQAEWNGMTDPAVWSDAFYAMYSAILAHFKVTCSQMPITIWTGMPGGAAASSPYVLLAHQNAANIFPGAALGTSYYDGQTYDYVHPKSGWHQVNGARGALVALRRLGIAGYGTSDSGPRMVSATRDGLFCMITTSGHPLKMDGRQLTGFQAWYADWSASVQVLGATVYDAHTILLLLEKPAVQARIRYMGDCAQPGYSPVKDCQDCFIPGFKGMLMVPSILDVQCSS